MRTSSRSTQFIIVGFVQHGVEIFKHYSKFSSQSFPGKELTHGTPVGMTLSSPIIFSLSYLQFRAFASFAKKINREIKNNLVITQWKSKPKTVFLICDPNIKFIRHVLLKEDLKKKKRRLISKEIYLILIISYYPYQFVHANLCSHVKKVPETQSQVDSKVHVGCSSLFYWAPFFFFLVLLILTSAISWIMITCFHVFPAVCACSPSPDVDLGIWAEEACTFWPL